MARRRMFTEAERALIQAHYATKSSEELAALLNRDRISIKNYVARNKLSKDGVCASRFPKGHKPWNAGLKGWSAPGSEKSRFQKGNAPHNGLGYEVGTVVARHKTGEAKPYKYRRLGKQQWVLSHRYNWVQVHGPIPKGHLLRCVNGDTLNDAPDNWELITRKANAARNQIHGAHSAHQTMSPDYLAATLTKGRPELRPAVRANPDLLETQRLKITLNRTLKNVLGNPT